MRASSPAGRSIAGRNSFWMRSRSDRANSSSISDAAGSRFLAAADGHRVRNGQDRETRQRIQSPPGHKRGRVMSHAVEYREVAKADAPKLVPFFEAFYGQWFGEPVTSNSVQRRIDQARGIETFVVAEREGKLLGFASLRLVPSLDLTPYAELSDLFVAGLYRRQGVGRGLFWIIEQRARERGADRLILTTGRR